MRLIIKLEILNLNSDELKIFKKDMQEAFQKGAESEFENLDFEILPEEDINKSLETKGAIAYKAVMNNEIVGGAIVVIDELTQHNHLDFLHVKYGIQGKGIGKFIWNKIEKKYPNTKVWETVTPYFEKRNIHFYVNLCGFYIVEFFYPSHEEENIANDMMGNSYLFRFEKVMKR